MLYCISVYWTPVIETQLWHPFFWQSYTVWKEWMPDSIWRSYMHVFMCLFWLFYCTVTLLHFNKDKRHPTLQINQSERVCYELYTYSIVSVHLMEAWSHKLISWSWNFSFDNRPNRWCVLHGVVNILVSHPYFGAPFPHGSGSHTTRV